MEHPGTIELLKKYESQNVTFIEEDGFWPIVWERAKGVDVWDEAGKKYLDLTAAFGVAAAGHANNRVVRAGKQQMGRLLHAMGDVHPHSLKAELAQELSRITFERWNAGIGKTIFGNSGFEAVEAALKTAILATGRNKILAFKGGYHGLGYGALNATHREYFRTPFLSQLRSFSEFVPFPTNPGGMASALKEISDKLSTREYGAILLEPVQARGGINIPPTEFLGILRDLCNQHGTLLVLDEIYTGFGRTGKWFATEHSQVIPDVITVGKALTGGFPLSGCIGKADLMDRAWPPSPGEALHTSTFLGHPVGCAMALAQITEITRRNLPEKSRTLGAYLLKALQKLESANANLHLAARGIGLMAGLELTRPDGTPGTPECLILIKRLLHRGFIFLPEGEHSNILSFTPPLTITRRELGRAVQAIHEEIVRL